MGVARTPEALERRRARQRAYGAAHRQEGAARSTAWAAANPERNREHKRRYRMKNAERIAEEERKRRLAAHRQKTEAAASRPRPDRCEVCGGEEGPRKRAMHWDHNHTTGEFRGWLCARCNMTLGQVKDDPALLRKLAEYLENNHAD